MLNYKISECNIKFTIIQIVEKEEEISDEYYLNQNKKMGKMLFLLCHEANGLLFSGVH